ncbi:DciA family protein [Streptomyces sp. NPDC007991]|uniref:DciA family protein n=1 Tax=Streptomyces sp. NPDC007991 TaxID=3364803 RepID=UPI0036E989FB
MTQQASGADLARQALAAARANAKNSPAVAPKKTRPTMRVHRGERADPQGLAGILGKLTAEQGWDQNLDGGNVIDQWPTLCPQYDGLVQPVHYDEQAGRLDLRPSTHTYGAQLRLLGGQLAKQINDKMGRPVVRTIRVLPVGTIDTTQTTVAATGPVPDAPVKTRETASPGYRATLEAALTHRPAKPPTNPYVAEAIARQEAALRAKRLPEDEHREAYWELDRLKSAEVDRSEAVRRAAIARARKERAGGDVPRRLFGAA